MMISNYELSEVYHIAALMLRENVDRALILRAISRCEGFEGIRDLMIMWRDDANQTERDDTLKALAESLSDIDRAMEDY
jgi:hypothetical protein